MQLKLMCLKVQYGRCRVFESVRVCVYIYTSV